MHDAKFSSSKRIQLIYFTIIPSFPSLKLTPFISSLKLTPSHYFLLAYSHYFLLAYYSTLQCLFQSTTTYPSRKDSQNIFSYRFTLLHNRSRFHIPFHLDSTSHSISISHPVLQSPLNLYFQVLNSTSTPFFTPSNPHPHPIPSSHISKSPLAIPFSCNYFLTSPDPLTRSTSDSFFKIFQTILNSILASKHPLNPHAFPSSSPHPHSKSPDPPNPQFDSCFTSPNIHSFHMQLLSSNLRIPTQSTSPSPYPFPALRFQILTQFYTHSLLHNLKSPVIPHPIPSSHLQIQLNPPSISLLMLPHPHSFTSKESFHSIHHPVPSSRFRLFLYLQIPLNLHPTPSSHLQILTQSYFDSLPNSI